MMNAFRNLNAFYNSCLYHHGVCLKTNGNVQASFCFYIIACIQADICSCSNSANKVFWGLGFWGGGRRRCVVGVSKLFRRSDK